MLLVFAHDSLLCSWLLLLLPMLSLCPPYDSCYLSWLSAALSYVSPMILATFSWLLLALAYAFLILALGIQNGRGEGGGL